MTETLEQAARRLTQGIGELEKVYQYKDAEGRLLFCNLRIVQQHGKKLFA